jgi:hypothetical protein
LEVPSSKYPVGQAHEGGGNLLFPTHRKQVFSSQFLQGKIHSYENEFIRKKF